jgi:CRISPR system Cascade subunit CasB
MTVERIDARHATTAPPRHAAAAAFCERLEALSAGDRARLKRCAGRDMGQSTEALGLFFRLLGSGVAPRQEETFFLVATLFPLAESAQGDSLGASLARVRTAENAPGLDRRVERLLDADEAQLPFRLRQAVHLLGSQRVGVEWPRLLADLLQWNHPTRYVQKEWARAYFAPRDTEDITIE